MVKRFHDVPYHTFSLLSDMVVICPKCGKAGTVHFDKEHRIARFQCASCYLKKETVPVGKNAYEVTAQCTSTGKYFRTSVPDNKIRGQKLKVSCPYCEEFVMGEVSDTGNRRIVVLEDIRHAEDPYFHYPLYFQASYRGKTIWALNRAHLQYMIAYLSADLRTVQSDFHETYKTMRSQSDMLPAFMKTAKNRAGIVKLLTKLQSK
ncbi:MAG: hypothetical protein K2P35_13785 [Lachnospiraceae bacterium]|jgi:hypothetical protein|nr:hypothetical protein [Lachnospiraceae bacterium]